MSEVILSTDAHWPSEDDMVYHNLNWFKCGVSRRQFDTFVAHTEMGREFEAIVVNDGLLDGPLPFDGNFFNDGHIFTREEILNELKEDCEKLATKIQDFWHDHVCEIVSREGLVNLQDVRQFQRYHDLFEQISDRLNTDGTYDVNAIDKLAEIISIRSITSDAKLCEALMTKYKVAQQYEEEYYDWDTFHEMYKENAGPKFGSYHWDETIQTQRAIDLFALDHPGGFIGYLLQLTREWYPALQEVHCIEELCDYFKPRPPVVYWKLERPRWTEFAMESN